MGSNHHLSTVLLCASLTFTGAAWRGLTTVSLMRDRHNVFNQVCMSVLDGLVIVFGVTTALLLAEMVR